MKILVVDDQIQILKTYVRLFKDHEVRAAEHALEAAREFEKGFKPDIVISDWNMPMLTGGDLCKLMRAVGYDGPFFIVSGELRKDEIERCGATGCFLKPLTRSDIAKILSGT